MSPVEHLVVLMLENRSFDHVFGFLDPDADEIDGLTGAESNSDDDGQVVLVRRGASFTGPADPGHHFADVNEQIFETPDPAPGAKPTMNGFVRNYAKQPG